MFASSGSFRLQTHRSRRPHESPSGLSVLNTLKQTSEYSRIPRIMGQTHDSSGRRATARAAGRRRHRATSAAAGTGVASVRLWPPVARRPRLHPRTMRSSRARTSATWRRVPSSRDVPRVRQAPASAPPRPGQASGINILLASVRTQGAN